MTGRCYEMKKEYSQEEINEILLSKSLDEFYMAIVQKKDNPSDETYPIYSPSLLDEESKEMMNRVNEAEKLAADYDASGMLAGILSNLKDFMWSTAKLKAEMIITMIGDQLYSLSERSFLDLNSWEILHYEPVTNYYDDTNVRIKICTPEEDPNLCEDCVVLDGDDDSYYNQYGDEMLARRDLSDVTEDFLREVSQKKKQLS